jgi:hypothetical protein
VAFGRAATSADTREDPGDRSVGTAADSGPTAAGLRWAALLRRAFGFDGLACPCRGRLRLVALIDGGVGHPPHPGASGPAHRDPRAEALSIKLRPDGEVKVLEFGLAKSDRRRTSRFAATADRAVVPARRAWRVDPMQGLRAEWPANRRQRRSTIQMSASARAAP